MVREPPRFTQGVSSAASDVYNIQALAKFEQAKAEQIAVGVANSGGLMPRNLTTEQRRAVVALVKNVTTKII